MNQEWWTRLYDSMANLFRRTPPHLRGRVPVECGEGKLSPVYTGDWPRHVPPAADDVGRAFLARAPPLAPELEAKRKAEELYETLTREANARRFVPLAEYPTVFEYEAHKAGASMRPRGHIRNATEPLWTHGGP